MTELTAVSDEGRRVVATDEGEAPPTLLVVHPGGGDATTWTGVSDRLRHEARVVRIHRRLYARGGPFARPHTMAVEADDILAVAGLLEEPVLLVGHSSGAVAALEAALRAPSAFAGLVVYEPPLPTTTLVAGEAGARSRAALDAGDPIEAMRIHLRDVVRMPPDMVDTVLADPDARTAFATYAAAQVADNEAIDALGVGVDRFADLQTPTVVIEGELSPPHLRERADDLARTLPHASVVTLPGQGHVAHLAAPDLLATTVRDAARRLLGA